jgi:hypothetical protein
MTLRTVGLVVLGAAGLVALPACKKEEVAPPASQAPAAPATAPQAAAPSAPADAPQAPDTTPRGSVRGTVTFTGEPPAMADLPPSADPSCAGRPQKEESVLVKDGKLRNVFVRVRGTVANAKAAPTTPVVIDQSQCTYQPRVQGAMAGQPMMVKNSDGTLHNVRALANGKSVFNVAQPPNAPAVPKPLPEGAELLKLKCDIHPWMTAFVAVSPHPYFATTGEDGAFVLEGLPVGTYTLEAWHETFGTKTAEVSVKEGAAAEASFAFSASDASATAK